MFLHWPHKGDFTVQIVQILDGHLNVHSGWCFFFSLWSFLCSVNRVKMFVVAIPGFFFVGLDYNVVLINGSITFCCLFFK